MLMNFLQSARAQLENHNHVPAHGKTNLAPTTEAVSTPARGGGLGLALTITGIVMGGTLIHSGTKKYIAPRVEGFIDKLVA